jgi:hypothetical protein
VESPSFLSFLGEVEIALWVAVLSVIAVKQQWRDYWPVAGFIGVRLLGNGTLTILHARAVHSPSPQLDYQAYFFVYWGSFAVQYVWALLIVSSLFRVAFTPLKGLQKLSIMMLGFVAVISGFLAIGSAAVTPNMSGIHLLMVAVSHLQRAQSLVTLCLLVPVLLVIRPLGLSFRSPIFGIALGLGLMSMNDLAQFAWLALHGWDFRFGPINGVVVCSILSLWMAFLVLPEPKRGNIAPRLLRVNERLIGAA